MRTQLLILFSCTALLCACSGSSNSSGSTSGSTGGTTTGGSGGSTGGTSGSSACTITLTGAVSATLGCNAPQAAFDSQNQTGSLAIQATQTTNGAPDFALTLRTNADFASGTYDFTTSSVTGEGATYTAQAAQGNVWGADQSNAKGSVSVNLTNVTSQGSANGGTAYAVHGTATATLVPSGSATGNITASVTF